MIAPSDILRFKFDDVYHGLAECNGMLKVNYDELIIEYVVKDSFIGVFKSNVKHLKIKFEQIIEVEFVNTFWKKRLIIKPLSMIDSHNFPVTDQGEIVLKLKKKEKGTLLTAERLSSFINMRIAEIRLEKLDK